jgi:peptidoglycan/LPS O-acetylase OafA/YrhL
MVIPAMPEPVSRQDLSAAEIRPSERPSQHPSELSPNLDLLRTVAVSLVLLSHLEEQIYQEQSNPVLGDLGRLGVLLFFVHTALVLMYSMQRSGLSGWPLMKSFYIRRFFRIYPLSILAVLIVVALNWDSASRGFFVGPRPGFGALLSNLAIVQNLTGSDYAVVPMWSLPIEVQMYLILPFLFLWRRRSVATMMALLGASFLLRHFFIWQLTPRAWYELMEFVPNFLAGVLAFTLPQKKIIPGWLWPPFLALLVLIYAALHSRRVGGVLCFLLGWAIPLFKEITFSPLRFVSHKIATYSYGLYLGHPFFIAIALVQHHSWILFWLMWLFIPPIVYYGFEHPAMRLGARLAEKAAPSRSALTSVAA